MLRSLVSSLNVVCPYFFLIFIRFSFAATGGVGLIPFLFLRFRQIGEAKEAAGPPGPRVRRLRAAVQPSDWGLSERRPVPQNVARDQGHQRLQAHGQEHGLRDGPCAYP